MPHTLLLPVSMPNVFPLHVINLLIRTDQGQGAAQAIEDAAALGTVLPRGTHPSDVPERLKLYENIRYERAHMLSLIHI